MKTFGKYWSIFQITLINSLAYPGELIGRSLMIVPFMWIFYQLWKVTFNAAGSDAISGLTLRDMLWYFMLAETIELGRPALARTMFENARFARRGARITRQGLIKAYGKAHTVIRSRLRRTREEDFQKSVSYPAALDASLAGEVTVERLFHYVKEHFTAHAVQMGVRENHL